MTLRARRVDLVELCREVLRRFEPAADSVRTELVAPDGPVPVWIDRNLIDTVLSNLLANALRFAPAGSTLTLRVAVDDARARLEVEDEGPGVPEAMRESVFERFLQGEGEDARSHGGAGLGLALTRELVHLHGGHMSLAPGAGGGLLPRGPAARHRASRARRDRPRTWWGSGRGARAASR